MSRTRLPIALMRLSPHSNVRNQPISKITIHHTAGNIGLEAGAEWLSRPTTLASYNYMISGDGRIALIVPEDRRSWASSSPSNDHQAITIGVANSTLAPTWRVSERAFETLLCLCTDICKRHNIPELIFSGTPHGSLTHHGMFANTDCPGQYLLSMFPEICYQVNRRLAPPTITELELPFSDIPNGHFSIPDFENLKKLGLFRGNQDGTAGFGQPMPVERIVTLTNRVINFMCGGESNANQAD